MNAAARLEGFRVARAVGAVHVDDAGGERGGLCASSCCSAASIASRAVHYRSAPRR